MRPLPATCFANWNPRVRFVGARIKGYDYVTGLGSPQANNIIPALVSQ